MLSSLSIVLFPWAMADRVPAAGVDAESVPGDPAEPVVTPGAMLAPDDCALPALLVPGAVVARAELAASPLPEDAPPELWAREVAGEIKIALIAMATMAVVRIIENPPFRFNFSALRWFPELSASLIIEDPADPARELIACAN